jgi:hypothetical protein
MNSPANSRALADQSEFALAILDPARPVPHGVIGPDGEPSARRFAVYRNNVVVGLRDALAAAFPVVRRIVGAEFFAAMARVYVTREPPASPIMLAYGKGFPDFIGSFGPASGVRYLRDVARLERAWLESCYASEARPLPTEVFATIAPQDIEGLRFRLHPSVRLVQSPFPVLSIWRTNLPESEPISIDLTRAEAVLIVRPDAEVEIHSLTAGGVAFIRALGADASIVGATRAAMMADRCFDLSDNLAGLFRANAVVDYLISDRADARRA